MLKLVSVFLFLLFIGPLSGEVPYDDLKNDVGLLLKKITSQTLHKEVLADYSKFEDTVLYEPLTVVGLLGSRLHKDLKAYQIYQKNLQTKLKKTESIKFLDIKTLSELCSSCEGTAQRLVDCAACKGTGDCKNSKCKDGKTIGNEYVGGKFTMVEKDCTTCSAVGTCGRCKGEGKVSVRCSKCKSSGYKYSSSVVMKLYEETLISLFDDIDVAREKAADDEKIAQGMIKIDGEWYTKAQLAKMEQEALDARKKADLAERRAMELARKNELETTAAQLFSEVDKNFYTKPNDAIAAILKFKEQNSDYSNMDKLSQALSFCKLVMEARDLEKKGAVGKAIKIYKKALSVKEYSFLNTKIDQLDNDTIGL